MLKGVPLGAAMFARLPAAQAQDPEPAEPAGSRKSSSPRRSATRTCRTCRSASRRSAPPRSKSCTCRTSPTTPRSCPLCRTRTAGSGGPGFSRAYMRGVASGESANHSGSAPSVGMYLDEQPVTTIGGALDIHLYDIARVEALAGPQGTLYGASSQAGTIRIITNKPDPAGSRRGYDLEANTIAHGDSGYIGEGFVNIPLSDDRRRAPRRLVPEGCRATSTTCWAR